MVLFLIISCLSCSLDTNWCGYLCLSYLLKLSYFCMAIFSCNLIFKLVLYLSKLSCFCMAIFSCDLILSVLLFLCHILDGLSKKNLANLFITSHYLQNEYLKAQQSLSGQRVNGEGPWFNSLGYLSVCYTQRTSLIVWYVISQLLGIQQQHVVKFTTESS